MPRLPLIVAMRRTSFSLGTLTLAQVTGDITLAQPITTLYHLGLDARDGSIMSTLRLPLRLAYIPPLLPLQCYGGGRWVLAAPLTVYQRFGSLSLNFYFCVYNLLPFFKLGYGCRY